MSVWVIIVAAGSGTRFGGTKQFEQLGDRRVIDWSIKTASIFTQNVIVVVAPEHVVKMRSSATASAVVVGGSTRSASVRAGLAVVPQDARIVVIHDAARPLASNQLFSSVIDAVEKGADAAIPGVAVVDTIKRVTGTSTDGSHALVLETLNRDELVAVQTPQAFKADVLRNAHTSSREASDDAALVEVINGTVVVVPGDPMNLKITTRQDMELIQRGMA